MTQAARQRMYSLVGIYWIARRGSRNLWGPATKARATRARTFVPLWPRPAAACFSRRGPSEQILLAAGLERAHYVAHLLALLALTNEERLLRLDDDQIVGAHHRHQPLPLAQDPAPLAPDLQRGAGLRGELGV